MQIRGLSSLVRPPSDHVWSLKRPTRPALGTTSYEDILSDLSFWQSPCADDESSMGGNCHAGFLKLASCFPINPILRRYVYGREVDKCTRIVVCGHSMGGAVAHIVTLNLLADLKRHGRDTENIISIAIGAPYFGDREMRDYVEKHNLSENLLTIVNQDDPIKGIAVKTLPIIEKILEVLPGIGFGGQALKVAAAAVATMEEQLPTFLKKMSQSLVGFGQELEDALKYTPLGRYMILTHQRLPGAGQKTQWYVTHMETAEEVIKTMRDTWKEEVSVNRMNEHKIIEYAAIYPKTTELGQLKIFEVNVITKNEDWYGEDPKPREVVFTNPFPLHIEEDRVSLTIVGPDASRKQKQLRITINGEHLDFFTLGEKPFTGIPDDKEKGIQKAVSADEIVLKCELKDNRDFDGVPEVHFTTHFEKRDLKITPKMIKLSSSRSDQSHSAKLVDYIAGTESRKGNGVRFVIESYQGLSRLLIKELPGIQSEQDSDIVDDDNVYTLERALYRKFTDLDFLNRSEDAIMGINPFRASEKLKDATEESQKEALRRCQMACDLFEIRQHLRKSCFVGLFGPQNGGKSTLIQTVWGVTVPDRGYLEHTTDPNLYKANGTSRMVIIDFPGTTAIDAQVANLANTCGGLSSILILVMKFDGDTSTDHIKQMKEARKLADDFNCCILLCISHCGLYKGTLKDKETVDAYRENYRQHLELDPANILMAELVENIEDLESRGIIGPDGVRMWLKDWMIKYDVFEDDEEQLNAAVNM
uniref:Fungal lipase-like domain-containing protein n=2 Tax=Branchiostoma floridae TaxID=7739 RepID=C3ZPA1_BRAFL|eukprot:XP_002589587.1 hypothetical protein BRAFLDRAFT_81557 [Branchiostoma floridae]